MAFRKFLQTITFMPHFFSMVIVISLFVQVFHPNLGPMNKLLKSVGSDGIDFFANPEMFKFIYVGVSTWMGLGYTAVFYLASLTGIDTCLYDAAIIDGASKIQRMLYIDIPCIMPTIVTFFLLRMGQLLNTDFVKLLLMQNPMNLSASETIQTYAYRMGFLNMNFGYGSAIGLFTALINLSLVLVSNKLTKKFTDTGIW